MARRKDKLLERIHLDRFRNLSGAKWCVITEGESPDFIVEEAGVRFGLEVTLAHQDYQPSGSKVRRGESDAQKVLQEARRRFEAAGGPAIDVKLTHRLQLDEVDDFVGRLLALRIGEFAIGEGLELRDKAGRKTSLHRSFRPAWLVVGDRVGWVLQDGAAVIQAAIDHKEDRVPIYRRACGNDVRLLVVADTDFNSGKVRVAAEAVFDGRGFSAIYFLSDPVQALELLVKSTEVP
ncbi:hypothetical protein [Caulobacter soli]|uniref:hypothetical protein n=1 Tax=Caulobacter soli TaxID=2708539 RepID=UPI0013EDACCE|nr:hypothetical protein [Caulobacter soli]